jgi:hypothetical protein
MRPAKPPARADRIGHGNGRLTGTASRPDAPGEPADSPLSVLTPEPSWSSGQDRPHHPLATTLSHGYSGP